MDLNWPSDHAGAVLSIDLDGICANYRLLCARASPAKCAAVLKSNAYGLGAVPVGKALYTAGCRHFFVAHLDEGLALRPYLNGDAAIFVLHGPPPGTECEFHRNNLIPVLNSIEQFAGWGRLAHAEGCRLPAIVQIDSGMSRMGLSAAEIDAWRLDPNLTDGIAVQFLMSHLACADQPENPMNQQQLERFRAARRALPAYPSSLANSSGIFLSKHFHFELVRSGAGLYGIAPISGSANPMRPVVRLQARIIQTRVINPGDHVGYSMGYTAREVRQIATVAIGYADGWSRNMSNCGFSLVDGVRVPQVGNISMDSVTLDVSALAAGRVAPGQLVDFIWTEHPVDAVAVLAGTIGYEVLTNLGPRISRQYIRSATRSESQG
jgi:alanine racemase